MLSKLCITNISSFPNPLPPSFPIFSGPFLSACSSSIQGLVPKRSIHNCRRGKDLGDNFLAGLSRSRGMDDCSILFPHFSDWNLCRASAHRRLGALASRSDFFCLPAPCRSPPATERELCGGEGCVISIIPFTSL